MQRIMETLFEIPYLIGVLVLGCLILRKSQGNVQHIAFGASAIVLSIGDAFHLIPRMYALWTDGLANHPEALGFGKLVTSVSMTVFYLLLYHVWQKRYDKNASPWTTAVYLLAGVRIFLCVLPQNRWFEETSPILWGIWRNIPFVLLGVLILVLYFREAKNHADRSFRHLWIAIALSFTFYVPVVLWADAIPLLGMLMIPKTCAYVWIVWTGYRDAERFQPSAKNNLSSS